MTTEAVTEREAKAMHRSTSESEGRGGPQIAAAFLLSR
jgi:hypothetical protein